MWIKICGIRDLNTAKQLAETDINAIGLNFYQPSPRYVSPEIAAQIVHSLPPTITPIGLFVNETISQIVQTCKQCNITTVQLHGDEPPERLAELQQTAPQLQLLKAFRIREDDFSPVLQELEEIRKLNVKLFAYLLDTHSKKLYGGSGKTLSWNSLANELQGEELQNDPQHRQPKQQRQPKWILAGGLTPQNVTAAIQALQPWGVDVASGIESDSKITQKSLVQQFVKNSRLASDSIKNSHKT